MSAAISAQNLAIGYKTSNRKIIVGRYPELALEKGKLTCLLGANGVGKSTLLKTITGNLDPLAGEVHIEDQPLAALTIKEKARKIAVVLTDKAHLGFTTVREMITLGRNPYTNWLNTLEIEDKAAIEQALEAIGMVDYADRPLIELSDGNLQKVIIGRAIAQETDIIVLDEPTIHLDVTNKTIIVELLQSLCQEHGKTILFSTHDLELASRFADKFWLLDNDRVIQGFPEDLMLEGEIDRVLGFTKIKKRHGQANLPGIQLVGNTTAMELLEVALKRSGYAIDDKGELKISHSEAGFGINGPGISVSRVKIESVLSELASYGSE